MPPEDGTEREHPDQPTPTTSPSFPWHDDALRPPAAESLPDWRSRVLDRSVGPAAQKAVERAQSLISAASLLLSTAEGEEFTVQNVAAKAGVSLRAFYQHFSGKDDLMIALIEQAQIVFAHLLHSHASAFEDPLDRLGAALYFAADARQHPARDSNAVLMRFVGRTSLTAPARVGIARQPVVLLMTDLVRDAMEAGHLERGDPHVSAFNVLTLHLGYQDARYIGNRTGATLPSPEQFVRFCVNALGAHVEEGWEQRFSLDDSQARLSRARSRETIDAFLRPPLGGKKDDHGS